MIILQTFDNEEKDFVLLPSIKVALNVAKKLHPFMMCQEDGTESYGTLTKISSYIMDKSLANAKQSKISDLECLDKYCIELLYSNLKNAFSLCSSFLKRSASAETKRFQVCVDLCIFNPLFS